MKKPSDTAQIAAGQRHRAERQISFKQETAEDAMMFNEKRLLHELQVQRIQLEMQNEALQEARDAAERALESYAELFDYAPIAYFTLTPTGSIRSTNFRGGGVIGR